MSELIGDHRRCSTCGEWGWFGGKYNNHYCKPMWECRAEWLGEDEGWTVIHAHDSESAAEKFSERYDCDGGEYVIIGGRGDYIVQVRKPKDDLDGPDPAFERFAIEGETVPQYNATKIEEAA